MSVVIQVDRLSKQYRLGVIGGKRLVDDVNRWWAKLRGQEDPLSKIGSPRPEVSGFKSQVSADAIWALRDVSFEVKQGEVLGIIGRNGAGKSTLLKILSRVTAPTSGEVRVKGRIASLLEVGTGFHPELTGRENIFLNGAILGMSKTETRAKFDEIVAFSEVERFIDTPVKRYSSGMYVRLAFAVAAHLEPEILIVDEVLAVGDAQFQKKCVGKMGDVAREGRTVLFVSHNMAAVRALCSRGLLVEGGRIRREGPAPEVVGRYLQQATSAPCRRNWTDPRQAPGNADVRLLSVEICPPEGEPAITIDTGAEIRVAFENFRPGINLDCTISVVNGEGLLLFETGCIVSGNLDSRAGTYTVVGKIPGHFLNCGRYSLNVLFGKDEKYVLFKHDEIAAFEVEHTTTGQGTNTSVARGVVRPILDWHVAFASGSHAAPSQENAAEGQASVIRE